MSVNRPTTRQRTLERRAATERAILDSVECLLEQRSFRDLSVEDVMAAAGLSRTAFYRYFPDLEEVLLRLMSDVADELAQASTYWLNGADHIDSMLESGSALAKVYESRGRVVLAFTDAASSGIDIERAWREAVERFVADAHDRISTLAEVGEVDVEHPLEVARALVWMTERYLLEAFGRSTDRTVSVEEATGVLVTVWRRTLFARI